MTISSPATNTHATTFPRACTDRVAGRLPEDVPVETLASILIAVMDGLQYQWLLDDSIDMVESYRALARLLSAALGQDQTLERHCRTRDSIEGKGDLSDAAKHTGSEPIGAAAAN